MSKSVWVVWNDHYHPRATYEPIAAQLFGGPGWQLQATEDIRYARYWCCRPRRRWR